MSKEKQIDLVEETLKKAYADELVISEPTAEWQASLMACIKDEYRLEEAEVENLENSFLYYSWVAAAVAASLLIVSAILFSIPSNDIEEDLQELYSDNTLETLTMEIASR